MNKGIKFRIKLDDDRMRRVRYLAEQEGLTPEKWLEAKVEELTPKLLERDHELTPTQAGQELGVSKFSVLRYYHDGEFPNATALTARTIRIPMRDVVSFKQRRLARI